MFRPHAVRSIGATFCLLGSACQALTGSVDVITPPAGSAQAPGSMPSGAMTAAPPSSGEGPSRGPGSDPAAVGGGASELPGVGAPLVPGTPPSNAGAGGSPDAGAPGEPEPEPPPPAPRPVLVAGDASELDRVGEEGGEPHLGVCEGGVVIGVRPTANPTEEVFGQRLTFVEPVCGTLMLEPGSAADPAIGSVRVIADESLLMWEESEVYRGPPVTEVPDPRLVWITQPPTVCPESAPVLVGLSGEYDPSAPDSTVTAAIRSLVIECAPLVIAPDGIQVSASANGRQQIASDQSFAAEGSAEYAASCADGAVTTQMVLHAGFWLDGFVLGCSSLVSPHLPGEPCADDGECRSGVCGSDATCEP